MALLKLVNILLLQSHLFFLCESDIPFNFDIVVQNKETSECKAPLWMFVGLLCLPNCKSTSDPFAVLLWHFLYLKLL